MTTSRTEDAGLVDLRRGFDGALIRPGDPGYDDARVLFNAMIDRRPSLIAQCASVSDVGSAIRFARQRGLEIAVRGGGHGVAGKALTDGGIVIDLRRMNGVSVDPEAHTARVGGGAQMTHLDRATQPYDLATTGGRVSTTGVGGFTLGGGSGWLERRFGLACDNLLSVELVTAAGERVLASESENPDLFWALHGGGGNFGVATAFTFRLHHLPSVTAGLMLWDTERAPEAVCAFRDLIESAPDELGGAILYLTAPAEEFVPEDLVGRPACLAVVTYAGAESDARDLVAPLVELAPSAELILEMPYAELQCMLDDPPGYRNYWSAEYLSAFPDQAVGAFCAASDEMLVPSASQSALFAQGGAVARGPGDYPIPWRKALWAVHPFALWEDPADDQRSIEWTRRVREAVLPWSMGSAYLNFIGDEGDDRVVAGLGRENYHRLAVVKAAFDPDNVFRLNHNIKPADGRG